MRSTKCRGVFLFLDIMTRYLARRDFKACFPLPRNRLTIYYMLVEKLKFEYCWKTAFLLVLSNLKHFCLKQVKMAFFSNVQNSFFPRACKMWSNGFGWVKSMHWSPFEPNIWSWYLKTRKPPGIVSISWFCVIFKPLFAKTKHLVNTEVNKFWPKYFYQNKLTKLNRKHIYTFFIAGTDLSQIRLLEFLR